MQNYMAMFPGMGQQQQAAGMAQGIMQAVGVNQPMQAAMMGQQMQAAGMNQPMQGVGMCQQMPAEMMGMQGGSGRTGGKYDTSEDAELATSLTYVGRATFASCKQEK